MSGSIRCATWFVRMEYLVLQNTPIMVYLTERRLGAGEPDGQKDERVAEPGPSIGQKCSAARSGAR